MTVDIRTERAEATMLRGGPANSQGWYAWIDAMPPGPAQLHVVGEVLVPNPGVEPLLSYREPQGINPAILLLELELRQAAGVWPQVMVWRQVRYDCVLGSVDYTTVAILSGGETVSVVDVDIVHFTATEFGRASTRDIETPFPLGRNGETGQPLRMRGGAPFSHLQRDGGMPFPMGLRPSRSDEVPFPRRWSGENPFPWMGSALPVCFSGSLARIQVDYCMDGARFTLNLPVGGRVRIKGASATVEASLEDYANKRVIVTVCGRFQFSPEQGCRYLLASSVGPAATFAKTD